ncbi:Putative CAP Gly-rich domain-containing protein [Septoria linicola]|uniref:CAP Gly-rich domain-containing protein n=1 Tax=Septoria linicola TaxID=215465 RepID=A0A9Q9ELI8_9PEZI|nr:putative CAP Gly-rich domain-containing protein [Septoria linicola]USW54389.1 Putative CAP Gly-rich domain-containing protein [Septoria linicola]
MALQTPRSGLQRPSFGTASSPSLRASATAASRKASLQALTGQKSTTPVKMDAEKLEVGDVVNVPGDMYGIVKFVGSVRGKSGKFVGVELDREFAARGKNDGDVEGTQYFNTTIPGAGIFLPVHRAEKRQSPSVSLDSFPNTPGTPSYSTGMNGLTGAGLKFSQSVGPGARPQSPQFKPRRPSLPRPESPLRRQTPNLQPTPARNPLGSSVRGTRSATTPNKPNLKASTSGRPSNAVPTPRPYSRAGSRLGNRPDDIQEERTPVGVARSADRRNGSQGSVKSFSQPLRSTSRMGAGNADEEVMRLRTELAERDKRLAEQAANLSDMEASVKELSGLLPTDGQLDRKPSFIRDEDDASTAQLRQMLREKNEKIQILTAEFDTHRADFRSTLDSLEMASSETERVYEEQKQDLIAQVQELSQRLGELEELNQNKKEFDDVANQLKQLEDFVQELEEGLEDARRGEAEARGEVEFLRGEVERGRSELKREREKAASAMASNGGGMSPKELEQKEDEIRGLKAIIHSFSTRPESSKSPGGLDDMTKLKTALQDSQKEKEELEHELEQLRRDSALTNGHHARNESDMTATPAQTTTTRARADTVKQTFAEHAKRVGLGSGSAGDDSGSKPSDSSTPAVYCEMCGSADHDTLDCNHFQSGHDSTDASDEHADDGEYPAFRHARNHSAAPAPLALSPFKGSKENLDPLIEKVSQEDVKSNGAGSKDEEKWCALCEKDGHLAYECPDEQY